MAQEPAQVHEHRPRGPPRRRREPRSVVMPFLAYWWGDSMLLAACLVAQALGVVLVPGLRDHRGMAAQGLGLPRHRRVYDRDDRSVHRRHGHGAGAVTRTCAGPSCNESLEGRRKSARWCSHTCRVAGYSALRASPYADGTRPRDQSDVRNGAAVNKAVAEYEARIRSRRTNG